MLHTGDISHLSKPEEFDTVDQILSQRAPATCSSFPASTMCWKTTASNTCERYGKNTKGAGWYSFDQKGVHFIGLVNVMNLKAGGWARWAPSNWSGWRTTSSISPGSTPIVVFAHIPLWSVYPEWGWGTDDSAQALAYLKRFGSVTVLNGHIHQIMQKVEGNVTFHTATSTAFPQPHPGEAPSPGPMKVPAEQLRSLLGVTDVKVR